MKMVKEHVEPDTVDEKIAEVRIADLKGAVTSAKSGNTRAESSEFGRR